MKHPKHAKKNETASTLTAMALGTIALAMCVYAPIPPSSAIAETEEPPAKEVHFHTGLTDNEYRLKGEWIDRGYESVFDYSNALEEKRQEAVGITDEASNAYSVIITDDEVAQIQAYEDKMTNAKTFKQYEENEEPLGALLEDIESRMPKFRHYGGGGTVAEGILTRAGGVNQFNGHRETWYSSNWREHNRIGEWTLGSDGVYRDSDGYVVVASPWGANGDLIETSLGTGKAYDYCPSGAVDIYTKW